MRRDVAQQLRFDNATDWAAAVGVLLLPIAYCVVAAYEEGIPFLVDYASRFYTGNAVWWLAVTLIAALSTQDHANGVLLRHNAQVKQMLQEHAAPEAFQPLDGGPPRMAVRDTTEQEPVEATPGVRDLGMRFGQWCRLLKEQTARADFQILKMAFNTLLIPSWFMAIAMTNVPTTAPDAMLLVTVSGYMAFNMGYRIGVRRALRSNLELLGVVTDSNS